MCPLLFPAWLPHQLQIHCGLHVSVATKHSPRPGMITIGRKGAVGGSQGGGVLSYREGLDVE